MHNALRALHTLGVEQLRVGWCDLHGTLRGKTLVLGDAAAAADSPGQAACFDAAWRQLQAGVGMVGTLLLKDCTDRTALPVFDAAAMAVHPTLARLAGASNVLLLADPDSLQRLPWAPDTAWLRAQPHWADGAGAVPVPLDTRHALQRALAALQAQGFGLTVGVELEFHVHRIVDDGLGAEQAGWPAAVPQLRHLHTGHTLLGEASADLAADALAIVRRTALGLGLPLRTLEVEFGPSQFEAVFSPQDALAAADCVVRFRNGVRQALRRAGYHASFACKPPLSHSVASGWHLHQSLRDAQGANAFVRAGPDANAPAGDARRLLSDAGAHWLAGLRAHAAGMAALCVPSIGGYVRFQGSVMAPQLAVWGVDNRGALLRVVGGPGDAATRIENRIAEPMANPYLALAAQVWAGLDGLQRRLDPGPACEAPYAHGGLMVHDQAHDQTHDQAQPALPTSLQAALDALQADDVLQHGLGADLAHVLQCVRRQELASHAAAQDPADWLARATFARY
jgi:glutamine synthetase